MFESNVKILILYAILHMILPRTLQSLIMTTTSNGKEIPKEWRKI